MSLKFGDEDFAKARKALTEADINFRNTYMHTPEGSFYMTEGKFIARMPLESPEKARGAFK